MASSKGPTVVPIPRVSGITPEEVVSQYFAKNKPCILTNTNGFGWPAFKKWSLEYFRDTYGEQTALVTGNLPLDGSDNVPYQLYPIDQFVKGPLKLSEIIDTMISGSEVLYLNQQPLDGLFKGVEDDLDFKKIVPFEKIDRDPNIWVGGKGTKSGWHYDLAHNILIQVTGEKHIRIAHPNQSPYMHPYIDARHKSQVDPWHPERYRDYCKATVMEGTLQPGDVLVLPVLWWHYITSLSPSISINCWVDQSSAVDNWQQKFTAVQRFKFWVHSWYEFWKAFWGFPRYTRLFSAASDGVAEGLSWHNWFRSWLRIPPIKTDIQRALDSIKARPAKQ